MRKRQHFPLGGLLARVVVGVVVVSAALVPAPSASALAIDCSYTPGLPAFVDRLKDSSLTCANRGEPRGSTPGGGQLGRPGSTVGGAASTAVSACRYPAPSVPDWLYANGPVFAVDLPVVHYPDPGGSDDVLADYRTEYRDAKGNRFATRDYVVSTKRSLTVPARMYLTDYNLVHYPAQISLGWQCDQPRWGAESYSDLTPTAGPVDPGVTTPLPAGIFTPPVIVGGSSIGAIPGRPGEYFYRLDVRNDDSEPQAALISIDVGQLAITEVLGLPGAGSCPAATPRTQICSVSSVLPGQTQTFTFRVRAEPGYEKTGRLTAKVDSLVAVPRRFVSSSVTQVGVG
ncbi:hypothetical protein NVV95_15335 [Herbiconiux sp. CPCC 205716]|uniref:DUF11 domain-containing protein n=1 Tax=Herbiconiux gentiana TaxID=2970912 RepID=A0ABT2GKU2_9MICO|nr:hypothetical protein [Herbiconiux gentiana]MCS5715920.1 hypothetical protein [Herbiconiux gentiana]